MNPNDQSQLGILEVLEEEGEDEHLWFIAPVLRNAGTGEKELNCEVTLLT